MTGILNTKGINIAIDGKALRGSTDLITLENSLHYVLDDLTLIERYAFRGIAHL